MKQRQKISHLLKEFREQYNLTQLSAAKWCLLAPGTYRDYEQGRSEPGRGIDYMIRHRIADYARDYEQYMAKQLGEENSDDELETVPS